MNDYNERSVGLPIGATLSMNDPRWGRGDGNGDTPRRNEPKRPDPRNGDGPPDLDEMWHNFNRRLSGLFRRMGGGGGGPRPDGARAARVGVGIVVGVLIAVYLGSGIFIVPDGQMGVVLRFGRYAGDVGPGTHWRAPYPFASSRVVDTGQTRSIEVGRNNMVPGANVADASLLTRDGDIVDVGVAIQYRIRSATDYLFRSVDPERSVAQAAQAALREIVGTRPTADLLTGGDHAALRDQLTQAIQRDLDLNGTGLAVTGMTIQRVQLPQPVQAAAAEVNKARDEGDAAKAAAQAYASDLLPRARGDAAKLADEANAYAARVVAQARGDADRFEQVYAQYQKAPDVIRERMYLQTMQDIYANTTKVYVGSRASGNMLYLPLDKLVAQSRERAANDAAAPASDADASAATLAASGAGASADLPDGATASAAASGAAAASAASGQGDALRSREAFRSRVREDDMQ